ncbi:hypothetical protein C3F09_00995 [candidate division GN15 bacterium]|uniref:N-acetyltransferase domain-containing protein n=1 Tax=candidate division GN15 bacterium TaxID=2072418 RepID=A0A855XBL1_9BACT|nr:MAG: hypothetical protein C3F09_00995 [candidate division GN15 bacterium]
MGALGRFISHVRQGRFDLIGKAISERVPWWLFHKGKAFIYVLNRPTSPDASTPPLPAPYHCRAATREEMPACSRITGLDVTEYHRRFEAGDVCYGVFANNRPVNINWVHSGSCYIRGMGYSLVSAAVDKYIYGIMTDPAERGKGLYKRCLVNLAHHFFAAGAERLIQMVEDGNTPVLNTLPQLGYVKTQEIRHVTVLGIKRTRATDLTTHVDSVRWFIKLPKDRFVI